MLAMAITVEGGTGNGVQLYDAANGTLRVLDSSASTYSGLSWRKQSASLAVLRSAADDAHESPTHVALAWPDLAGSPTQVKVLDAKSALGADLRIVRFQGAAVVRGWHPALRGRRPVVAKATAPVSGRRATPPRRRQRERRRTPDVQVWHPADTATVMARQKVDARRERQRSMLAAWWIGDERFVRIATSLDEDATPLPHQPRALVIDTRSFAMERSIGRVFANAWVVHLGPGTRSGTIARVEDATLQGGPRRALRAVPEGRPLLDDGDCLGPADQHHAVGAGVVRRRESDTTGPQKPTFGIAGWSRDRAVLLYDKHDASGRSRPMARGPRASPAAARPRPGIATRGSIPTRSADRSRAADARRAVRPRIEEVRLRPRRPRWPVGIVGDVAGVARQAGQSPGESAQGRAVRLRRAGVRRLARLLRRGHRPGWHQGGDGDQPVHGGVPPTGRATTVSFRSAKGAPLQASLFYPAGYEPGKTYPMVV